MKWTAMVAASAIAYGLTETQATQFFKKAMTITFGSRGTVALSSFTNDFYGIRLYGD